MIKTDRKYNYSQSGMSYFYKPIKQSPNSSWYTTVPYPRSSDTFKLLTTIKTCTYMPMLSGFKNCWHFSSTRALNMQMWVYLLSNCLNCYFKLIRPNQHIISSQMITYNQLFMSGQLISWLPANPMTWSDQLVMSISGLNWLLLKLGVDIFIEVYLDNIYRLPSQWILNPPCFS